MKKIFKEMILLIILFINFGANASDSIVQINKNSLKNLAGCKIELLNPNLGSDIYKINCQTKIKKIEKNALFHLIKDSEKKLVNDPESSDQWSLDFINIFSLWEKNIYGGSQFPIAIIDSGMNTFHEDLDQSILINKNEIANNGIDDDGNGYIDDYFGWNVISNNDSIIDDYDHGTPVAGILSAKHNNYLGIKGLAPNAPLVIVKMFGIEGGGRTEHAIKAIDYAVSRGAKIINLSWGGYSYSPLLEEVIKRCEGQGIIFVAASGNESNDNDVKPFYPASFKLKNILSVAAIDFRGDLSSFSNFGLNSVHLTAPGVSILTTVGEARYGYKEGSSFAAPHVSGLLNILWSENPSWSFVNLKAHLLRHCQKSSEQIQKIHCGGYFKF